MNFLKVVAILFFLGNCYSEPLQAQSVDKVHSIYLEFVGNARSILSVNYDRIFASSKNNLFHFGARAGIGFDNRDVDSSGIVNIPVELIALLGTKKHFLEFGLGYTASFAHEYTDTVSTPPRHYKPFYGAYIGRVGYRYMTLNGLFVLRIAPLLQLVQDPNWKVEGSFGLSLGVSFGSFHNKGKERL